MAYRLEIEPKPNPYGGERPPRQRQPLRAAMVVSVLVVLAGGLWLAYHAVGHGGSGAVPVIRADDSPIKVPPPQPGGMSVPDQNIYILNHEQHIDGRVEEILPPPETPLPRPTPTISDAPAAAQSTAPVGGARVSTPSSPAAATNAEGMAPLAAPTPLKETAPAVPTPVVPPKAPVAVAVTPPVPAQPPPIPAVPPKLRPLPAPAVAPVAHAGAPVHLQLGALRSVAAAQEEWDRLKRLEPAMLGHLHANAVRLDLGERGIFYRLEVGPVADAAQADRMCEALKHRNVGCLLVR